MSKHTPGYKANFLWGFEDSSLESIGYEFCNAKTEEYCRMQWGFLKEKIEEINEETAAERDRLRAILKRVDAWARTLPNCEPMADILKDIRAALAEPDK